MGKIRILDDTVVNQIAAGEVVERPASVVKELIENSVDAGATEVTVIISNGGRTNIEVLDNGSGMTREDALLAIERFGTSKVSSVDDLQAIATHGFRGEALPSIASVSRFTLTTAQDGGVGVKLEIEGGRLQNVVELPLSQGTRVSVRNLFFNVPARRKFLRAETTEAGLIKAILVDFALAYPPLRLSLVVDGAPALSFPGVHKFLERVRQVNLLSGKNLEVDQVKHTASGKFEIQAALTQPLNAVAGSARLRLLVNNRSVRDRLLLKAIRDGYGNFIRPGKYPAGVVKVSLPPGDIDINVHPQKTEVRFRDPNLVFSLLRYSISEALSKEHPLPNSGPQEQCAPWNVEERAAIPQTFSFERSRLLRPPVLTNWGEQTQEEAAPYLSEPPVPKAVEADRSIQLAQMRFVGQVFGLYLLFEGKERMAIVDMHAAHERVTFYRLKSQFYKGSIVAQNLLLPETISLPPERLSDFEQSLPELQKLGIDCERFGEDVLIVRSMPAVMGLASAKVFFEDLFSIDEWSDWGEVLRNHADAVLARLACHGSVRSGRELEAVEAYELVRALEEAEASAFCPHGRPVAVFVNSSELAQRFGRI